MVDEEEIIAFLLGETDEDARAAMEEALMSDEELSDLSRAVESELYDRYAAGTLGPARAQRFEARYLGDAEGSRRLYFARALATVAEERQRASAARPSPIERALQWLRTPRLALAGGLVCAAVVLFVVVGPREDEVRAADLVLVSQKTRSDSAIPRLPDAERVRLHLPLDSGGALAVYRVQVTVKGALRSLPVERGGGGALTLVVERGDLPGGRHILALVGGDSPDTLRPLAYYEIAVP